MPEHNTHQTSLGRLEEAVHKLTQHQATLSQANTDLNQKLDSVLDRLAALTTTPPSPKTPPSPPPFTIRGPT